MQIACAEFLKTDGRVATGAGLTFPGKGASAAFEKKIFVESDAEGVGGWRAPCPPRLAIKIAGLVVVLFAGFLSSAFAQEPPRDPLVRWMNRIAQHELQQREKAVDQIHTRAQAESRKRMVRKIMLKDLGGLPDYHGPLDDRVTGSIEAGSYIIDKVIYESLPGLYVTADLYRPKQPGRYPGVLLQSGHTPQGKPEDQRLAANLAMKGFVVLAFDPLGQGEREQTYSRQLGRPIIIDAVGEHLQMGAQAELLGQGLTRYFIWDAMRSLDYLASRPDVDATRLGAEGCSGGGALTTFLGGMDPRLKVVIPGCYPSSFQLLFGSGGPDTDMVFPDELGSGLDTADFVEESAPTPWLLQSTEHDQFHFTPAGVRLVYEEARNWYGLYGAEDKVGFMVGPGSHGMPLVAREAVYRWMIQYLKNGQGDYHEEPVKKMYTNHELLATKSGNVEDLPGSRKLYQVLHAEFHAKERPETVAELRAELVKLKIPTDRSAPEVKVLDNWNTPEGRREKIQFESEPGIWLDGTLYIPPSPGKKPAVLMVKGSKIWSIMPVTEMAERMAKLGRVVLEMDPRHCSDVFFRNEGEGPVAGDWVTNLEANWIGRNLPAMRAHDILRGVDLLAARPDVNQASIHAAARGVRGIWLLLAAAADPRIGKIWLDRTPYSLRSALDNSIATDLWDAVIPGFALHWDLDDLVKAMGTRPVMWTDPTGWMGNVVALGPPFQYRYVVGVATDFFNAQDDAYIRELLE
ncbi:MAG: acetylxylan esterase [Terriglobia bacterium]